MIALMLPLLACVAPGGSFGGTAVGNPGKLDFTGTDTPADVTLATATLDAIAVELTLCGGGGVARTDLSSPVDLLSDPTWPIQVDAGEYCSVVAELASLRLVGTTAGGTSFDVTLAPDDLVVEQGFLVDGDELLVGVPLVVDAEVLEGLGDDVELAQDDPEAEALAQDVSSGVTLGRDTDGDGVIDAALQGLADPESGSESGQATTDGGSAGCVSGGRVDPGVLALLLVALLGLARRATGRRPQ